MITLTSWLRLFMALVWIKNSWRKKSEPKCHNLLEKVSNFKFVLISLVVFVLRAPNGSNSDISYIFGQVLINLNIRRWHNLTKKWSRISYKKLISVVRLNQVIFVRKLIGVILEVWLNTLCQKILLLKGISFHRD